MTLFQEKKASTEKHKNTICFYDTAKWTSRTGRSLKSLWGINRIWLALGKRLWGKNQDADKIYKRKASSGYYRTWEMLVVHLHHFQRFYLLSAQTLEAKSSKNSSNVFIRDITFYRLMNEYYLYTWTYLYMLAINFKKFRY